MIANRSMPPGAFIPELAYADVHAAAEWLCRAFGFRERLKIGDHRIQLVHGGGSVVVTDGGRPRAAAALAADPGHSVMVRVDDARAHCAQARAAGAQILAEPADHPFGERQYAAVDPGGHRWVFSQSIADIDPRSWGGVVGDMEG
jgi:uncharacterized glyoxalase superfamily protein PhnB